MCGLGFLLLIIVVAVFAPLIANHNPNVPHPADLGQGPSGAHWLGTDEVGRDIFARVIFGARVSLQASIQIVVLATIAALPIGLIAGYFGGRVDSALMRVMDALFAFPPLLLALTVSALL